MIVGLSSHSVWLGLALTSPTVVVLLIASWFMARNTWERISNLVCGVLGVVVSVLVSGIVFSTRFRTPEFDKYLHVVYLIAVVGALFGVAIGSAVRSLRRSGGFIIHRWRDHRRV
jgi:drug/metabolite transporter (DMT)-like permease